MGCAQGLEGKSADWIKTWGAFILGAYAVVRPWVAAGWQRYVKRGTIEIYEMGQADVSYGPSGITIALRGSMRARDRDFFVKTAHVDVTEDQGGSRLVNDQVSIRFGSPSRRHRFPRL